MATPAMAAMMAAAKGNNFDLPWPRAIPAESDSISIPHGKSVETSEIPKSSLILLYRVQTRRNLFQWINLGLLPFLVPAGFVGIPQTSRCRRLPEKIGVSSRASKQGVDPRAQGPLPSEFFISA